MTRSDEFKDKLFALLREYDVEMEVVEEVSGYNTYATGVNFWSFSKFDDNGRLVADSVDVTVGTWENGK